MEQGSNEMRMRAEKWPLGFAPLEARWTLRRSDEIRVSMELRSGVLDFAEIAAGDGVEEGGSHRGGSGAVLNSGAQVLFGGVHQSAIGVIDDHDFLGAQEIVRYDQGAQGVLRHDTARVADNMSVSRFQTQGTNRKAGIHTGQDGELAFGSRGQFAQFMGARVDFVGGEDFVDDAHGQNSLAKPKRGSSGQWIASSEEKKQASGKPA